MSKLTRQGARNLTETIDRIASVVQDNSALLGIDPKIAKDFAYRCDLISDAVESTAVANFPKGAEFDASDIGETEPGPIIDGEVDHDSAGHFTQKEFSELTDVAEKLATVLSSIREEGIQDHGFGLTK